MEQTNAEVVAKKVWKIVRVIYYMLRKGISKRKLLVNLNTMLKRGKIAGMKAAILNLMFHHRRRHHSSASDRHDGHMSFALVPREEYEFCCSNSPVMSFPFHLGKGDKQRSGACHDDHDHAPETDEDVVVTASAVKKVLEMPGFVRSPMARQLTRITDSPLARQLTRITDSPLPLPLREVEVGDQNGTKLLNCP